MSRERSMIRRLGWSTAAVALLMSWCLAGPAAHAGSDEAPEISGTVTMWYLEDPNPAFLDAIKQGFEEAYPDVSLEMTEVPEDGFVTKVDTALVAQQPPDVAFVYEPRWMKAGAVLPLDDTIAEYGINTEDMNQVALSECLLDDQLYCLGSLTGSVVLLYNKDLFDEAGIEYPSAEAPMTVDEYAEISRALAEGGDFFGSSAGAPFTWASRLTHFSDDGTQIAGYVDDDATLHMYEVLAALARDEVSPSPGETEQISPADMLGAGQVAMAITDFEFGANTLDAAGYRWGAAPPPVEQAGDPSFVFVGTDKYGVFADGGNTEAGKALVAFIATEGNRLRIETTDQPPLDTTMLQEWAGDDESRQEVVAVLSTSTEPGLFVPGFWEVTAPLTDLYTQASAGETDAAEAIVDATADMQDRLDRQWETWEETG
jgi:multiple sugar transport system substrate-binding protein